MNRQDNAGGFHVLIDGEKWTEVTNLADTGSDDKVFVVDRTTGRIVFGDGTYGRQPKSGAEVTVSYRQGGGEAGNVQVSVTTPLPPRVGRFVVALTDQGIGVCTLGDSIEQYSGEKRVHYFFGQLLTADDLQDEQQYHRRMRYLHNRMLHGPGVVNGLKLGITKTDSATSVVVSPGFALDAEGREMVLHSPVNLELGKNPSPQYVTIEYTERETGWQLPPESGPRVASRVEEGSLVGLAGSNDCAALAIGRVVLGSSGWEVDPTFRPPRSH